MALVLNALEYSLVRRLDILLVGDGGGAKRFHLSIFHLPRPASCKPKEGLRMHHATRKARPVLPGTSPSELCYTGPTSFPSSVVGHHQRSQEPDAAQKLCLFTASSVPYTKHTYLAILSRRRALPTRSTLRGKVNRPLDMFSNPAWPIFRGFFSFHRHATQPIIYIISTSIHSVFGSRALSAFGPF